MNEKAGKNNAHPGAVKSLPLDPRVNERSVVERKRENATRKIIRQGTDMVHRGSSEGEGCRLNRVCNG